jgi:hypothetical protein
MITRLLSMQVTRTIPTLPLEIHHLILDIHLAAIRAAFLSHLPARPLLSSTDGALCALLVHSSWVEYLLPRLWAAPHLSSETLDRFISVLCRRPSLKALPSSILWCGPLSRRLPGLLDDPEIVLSSVQFAHVAITPFDGGLLRGVLSSLDPVRAEISLCVQNRDERMIARVDARRREDEGKTGLIQTNRNGLRFGGTETELCWAVELALTEWGRWSQGWIEMVEVGRKG